MKRLATALLSLAIIFTTTACSLIDHSGTTSQNTENSITDYTTESHDVDFNKETENEEASE